MRRQHLQPNLHFLKHLQYQVTHTARPLCSGLFSRSGVLFLTTLKPGVGSSLFQTCWTVQGSLNGMNYLGLEPKMTRAMYLFLPNFHKTTPHLIHLGSLSALYGNSQLRRLDIPWRTLFPQRTPWRLWIQYLLSKFKDSYLSWLLMPHLRGTLICASNFNNNKSKLVTERCLLFHAHVANFRLEVA